MKKVCILLSVLVLCACDNDAKKQQQERDDLETQIFSICKSNFASINVSEIYKDSVCSCQAEKMANVIFADKENVKKLRTSEAYRQKMSAMATRFTLECGKKYDTYK